MNLHDVAARLAGSPVLALTDGNPGGNNRLYRVECADGRVLALKVYPQIPGDTRDRLGVEFGALRFLAAHGVADAPRPVGLDRDAQVGLYQWIDGQRLNHITPDHIGAAVDFVARLQALGQADGAAQLPLASEACLSGAEIARQVRARIARLDEAVEDADVRAVLAGMTEELNQLSAAVTDEILPFGARVLSPSDFGFHNALAGSTGRLVFLDFEYFGWDDPVKLTADFLLHPGMMMDDKCRAAFCLAMRGLFCEDSGFNRRLRLFYPLYGLRWCAIILNEFLPARWRRRVFAGAGDAQATRARQLDKAARMLGHVGQMKGSMPYDA